MSLLMQALKRAEDAKQRRDTDTPGSAEATMESVAESAPAIDLAFAAPLETNADTASHAADGAALDASSRSSAAQSLELQLEPEPVVPAELVAPAIEPAPAEATSAFPTLDFFSEPEPEPKPESELKPMPASSAKPAAATADIAAAPPKASGRSIYEPPEPGLGPEPALRASPFVEPPKQPAAAFRQAEAGSAADRNAPNRLPFAADKEARPDVARERARMVFAAKHAPAKKRMIWTGVTLLLVGLMVGGVAYTYMEMQRSSSTIAFSVTPHEPTGQIGEPEESVIVTEMQPLVAAPFEAMSSAGNTDIPPVASAQRTPSEVSGADANQERQATRSIENEEQASHAIQIRKGSSESGVSSALQQAYRALLSGDAPTATREYRNVLRQDANNRDAMLGLAALAMQKGAVNEAGAHYARLLELDPSDPEAVAGLINIQSGDLMQAESRLKSVLGRHPQAASLWFALGNLYARQSRWGEAQHAYFQAYGAAPSNADYAFNLAIGLDQLGQSRLAADYYGKAIELARNTPHAFSSDAARGRLAELQSSMR